MVLAVAGGSDLLQRTQQVVFQKKQSRVSKVSGRGERGGERERMGEVEISGGGGGAIRFLSFHPSSYSQRW